MLLGVSASLTAPFTVLGRVADAGPTGLVYYLNGIVVGDEFYHVGTLYLLCDDPADTLEGISAANLQIIGWEGGGSFNHNDFDAFFGLPGSWSPNAFVPPDIGAPPIDSYVTVGGVPGDLFTNSNTTELDSTFLATPKSIAGGWYNVDPTNLQGKVVDAGAAGYWVPIAQFAVKRQYSKSLMNFLPSEMLVALTPMVNTGPGTPFYPAAELTGWFNLDLYFPDCWNSDHDCFTIGGWGCTDPDCCWDVCNVDPLCGWPGEGGWDQHCVALADLMCAGGANNDCCYQAHSGVCCRSEACCDTICGFIESCCTITWDATCANFASKWCAGPFDIDGDEIIDAADLGLLLADWGTINGCISADGSPIGGSQLGSLLSDWTPVP